MSTEKNTCQKSGTSVVFQKELSSCRECPNCRIYLDIDSDDWFNYNDEAAFCEKADKWIERMLRPYEKVLIPDWCPLKTNK